MNIKNEKENVEILHKLKKILDNGNSAEVHRTKEGEIKIYEVKKNIA